MIPGSIKVFRSTPYQSNPNIREEITKQVHDMLDKGIIKPSTSPYSSPVATVRKPDCTYRFCLDFRQLNSITTADLHPMALVDDSLESLESARLRIFSTLDLESGHWLCDLDSKAKPLCAFLTHDGLYEFQRLPFGLKKAPATFSQLMVSVFLR